MGSINCSVHRYRLKNTHINMATTKMELELKVEIAGDWSQNWETTPCTQNSTGAWEVSLDLAPGTYQYKYRVNDTWLVDSTKPSVRTAEGFHNNILTVEKVGKGDSTKVRTDSGIASSPSCPSMSPSSPSIPMSVSLPVLSEPQDMGDLYILNTRCQLTETIKTAFEGSGFSVKVSTESGVTDENLRGAKGYTAICIFVNKKISEEQVSILKDNGTKLILHCSAGFDNSPTKALKEAGIRAARVPSYSPGSIAEFAITQIMALAKNTHMSYVHTKKADFDITSMQCLLLENKTCGVIGTGLIGKKAAMKISGLVEKVICFDAFPDHEWIKTIPNASYEDLDTVLRTSDFITIHVPLLPQTHHMINEEAFAKMKQDVVLVNTSRGEIVHIPSLIKALEAKKMWGVALDVFEGEKKYIFHDKSQDKFRDDPDLGRLAQFEHVILSSHIAFYTDQAVEQITAKTLSNYKGFMGQEPLDDKAFIC